MSENLYGVKEFVWVSGDKVSRFDMQGVFANFINRPEVEPIETKYCSSENYMGILLTYALVRPELTSAIKEGVEKAAKKTSKKDVDKGPKGDTLH